MIFNRLALLTVVFLLGACAQFSDESNTLPAATQHAGSLSGSEASTVNVLPSTAQDNIVPELSQEEALSQSLLEQPDLYVQSKRILAPDIKAKIVNIINLFTQGELERAQKLVNKIISTELNITSNVHVLAGDIASANDHATQAFEHYQKAVAINAHNPKAANRLAMIMRARGEFFRAETLLTLAINAHPTHAPSYRNRAILYDLYLNDKQAALADYQAYSALLAMRKKRAGNATLSLTINETKTLKKDQQLVKRWLADVGRQVTALASIAATQQGTQ
jgi:tetratricopeptide (TPR) repeat protein